ncbi:MAG: SUMF1/EgtB/PvdO family nonheme iron enzyme [Prevotella sp.]|nr:SUMF1/EgtB/PvdO family nonheme iron enzyme [Prevotella sp.]
MNSRTLSRLPFFVVTALLFLASCGQRKNQAQAEQPKPLDPVIQQLISNMVTIEGGSFMMGARTFEEKSIGGNNEPLHYVTLSTFLLGRYEVTQAEWAAVMESNPSYHQGDMLPVERVTHRQVLEFIDRLNEMTGMQFRLPTEAEWEFAARGGNKSMGYLYAGSNRAEDVAWCGSDADYQPHIVGTKQPNELGLYDMSGNVREMCHDLYNYYTTENQTDPHGPTMSIGALTKNYVTRGGNYMNASNCRVAIRTHSEIDFFDEMLGFRLAM